MTNQSREAFEEEMQQANAFRAAKDHDSGYYTWSQLVEILAEYGLGRREHALSEGRRLGLEAAAYAIENNTCVCHCDLCKTAPCGKTSAEQIRALIVGGGEGV